jgi:hypothetical protein
MIKWILCFILMVFVLGLALDVFAQTPTQSIILGPNNEIAGQIVTYPPIPQWR